MAVDPMGIHHAIYLQLVDRIAAYRDEQAAIDSRVGFYIGTNVNRSIQENKLPFVAVLPPDLQPDNKKSSANKGYVHFNATYTIEIYANDRKYKDSYTDLNTVTAQRIMYLQQQIMNAIYSLKDFDFGLPVGSIGMRSGPTITMLYANNQNTEDDFLASRIEFQMSLPYIPPGNEGIPLETIAISTELFDFNENDLNT